MNLASLIKILSPSRLSRTSTSCVGGVSWRTEHGRKQLMRSALCWSFNQDTKWYDICFLYFPHTHTHTQVFIGFPQAYFERGVAKLKAGNSRGVLDLNKALALNPQLHQAFLARAAYYGRSGRYSKAILNCNEALRLEPKSVRAYLCRHVHIAYNTV